MQRCENVDVERNARSVQIATHHHSSISCGIVVDCVYGHVITAPMGCGRWQLLKFNQGTQLGLPAAQYTLIIVVHRLLH